MEKGERIMGMEIRPVYAGESMAWLVTSTDNAPEMGCEYLAGVCPHCGAIQGDNFVYGNCQSRGGAFSDLEDRSQLAAFPLPSFVGDRPQSLDWAFGRFTLEVEPRRIVFREPLMLPGGAWPWRMNR